MHGKPRVAGTRITVVQVLDLLAAGKTPAEIMSEDYYPELMLDDVRACLAFASRFIRDEGMVEMVVGMPGKPHYEKFVTRTSGN